MDELLETTWSDSVANDPKHRPQFFDRPSTTVRKEWARRPQEAHIAEGSKYRRLSVEEIAIIQGFDPTWVDVEGIRHNDKIGLLGNAVPPPLSKAIGSILRDSDLLQNKTYLELCAGIGGLSLGFPFLKPLAKIEMWDAACKVLRAHSPEGIVFEGTAQSYDFKQHKGRVGLLCGGPPCQPWSQAGARKGSSDPRDVMGFTPSAVADCVPEVFLFENVPGLLSGKEHADYRDDLFDKLRNPGPGLEYGLDYKILNAADFGTPQVRKRVFILGILGKSDAAARQLLKKVMENSTHHNPKKPAYKKLPWITLREALEGVEVNEPWRKWNIADSQYSDEIVEEQISSEQLKNAPRAANIPAQDLNRIGFWWPKREHSLKFMSEKWTFSSREQSIEKRALMAHHTIGAGSGPTSYAVGGDYCDGLEAVAEILKNNIKFVYWDMPVLNADSDFVKTTDAGYARSAWLSLLHDVTSALHRCLAAESFVAIHTDEDSVHYARNVLDEVFGYGNHVTTFAWEKKYSPQNDRNTPTDSFDYIIVYSTIDRGSITSKLGLTVKTGSLIDDGDPRGSYTAGHKGARSGSEKSKFKVNMPPYRWKLLKAELPNCKNYFFDEILGVLFMDRVKEPGSFSVEFECSDSNGAKVSAEYSFQIKEDEHGVISWEEPSDICWLNADGDGVIRTGPLRIKKENIACTSVDGCHSLILCAEGGSPFSGKSSAPGAGRFWEFAYSTLVRHIAKAAASFGKKGLSLPSQKKFVKKGETTKKISVRNWLPWHIGGKSEDGTRHLKQLAAAGYGKNMSQSHAKPETLGYYLLQIFASSEKDIVLTLGDNYGMMASAAMKYGRSCVHFIGPSEIDKGHWQETAKPRLIAVQGQKDEWGLTAEDGFQLADPGKIVNLNLSSSCIRKKGWDDISLLYDQQEDYFSFVAGLRGFVFWDNDKECFWDLSGNACVVIGPNDYLDEIMVSMLEAKIPRNRYLTVMYEKSCINDNSSIHSDIRLVRVPFGVV